MKRSSPPWYYLLILVVASEAVFLLPFVLPRVFRPTILALFELSNTQLGLCFSVYGLVALFSYLFGGPLADTFAPRKLIAISLWMTALGGIVFATYPVFWVLQVLYGYWGFTTIFLFWAPMVKATRVWGGSRAQGKAFGFLDGGRGITATLFGLLGVFIFAFFVGAQSEATSFLDQRAGFTYVVYVVSALIVGIGFLVWFFLKSDADERGYKLDKITPNELLLVLKLPSVWLLMVIILCAYTGYKITDIFAQYAQEVLFYDPVDSAQIGTFLLFMRAFTGVCIGFLADRTKPTFWLTVGFVFVFLGAFLFATGVTVASEWYFMLSNVIVAVGVYSVRALYFAVMQQGHIPLALTGTAVGLISLVGYSPDIFAGPGMGYLLDANPGVVGHQHVFWALAFFSVIGGTAAALYHKLYRT
ncbi:MFS transporter [Arenibacter sp. GZD96]|uniref:MFS transporter n=1 Tax=Aurantibrevibacter litoralis TaxID=3106030 RepID=UPI002AFDE02E|nr:MFS transporter [Arenibacter sp. GZD-96]MEA1786124.1 MFS transporter [Arenibacter sp. GZD-96]